MVSVSPGHPRPPNKYQSSSRGQQQPHGFRPLLPHPVSPPFWCPAQDLVEETTICTLRNEGGEEKSVILAPWVFKFQYAQESAGAPTVNVGPTPEILIL